MQLKTVRLLGKVCLLVGMLSCCKVPNTDRPSDAQVNLYRTDTVPASEGEGGLLEVGLRNVATGKKQGLWYYYRDGNLVRTESFQEGVENGPLVQFATGDDGKTSIVAFVYVVNGEFEGPAIRVNADSTLNLYDYYVKNHSVKSLFIDGEGYVEVELGDSAYQVGRIPLKK